MTDKRFDSCDLHEFDASGVLSFETFAVDTVFAMVSRGKWLDALPVFGCSRMLRRIGLKLTCQVVGKPRVEHELLNPTIILSCLIEQFLCRQDDVTLRDARRYPVQRDVVSNLAGSTDRSSRHWVAFLNRPSHKRVEKWASL